MAERLTKPLGEFKPREIDIIMLMASGLSNQEIANQLFITKETVRWYNKQIYSKLGTSRRTEAIAVAREMGLIRSLEATAHSTPSSQPTFPIPPGPFVGRETELAELTQLLAKPSHRLISIVAAGGMGKSRLSLELGQFVMKSFEHGAIFFDLTAIQSGAEITQFVLTECGLSSAGSQDPQAPLLDYLRKKEILLIFDNFEHVLSGTQLIADILSTASKVKIIATSRQRLNLRSESTYYLQPIVEQGSKLFLEVADMMYPQWRPAPDKVTQVDKIVKLVGGMPLALLIAATWLDTLSITEIGEEIEANLGFLAADAGDIPKRQHSMHAVIDPTWKRLTAEEQRAFSWASIFRGGFTRGLFEQVTGGSIRTLQTLLKRSLISHNHNRRYEIHPLLRQYALEKLEFSQMVDDAQLAHLETFRAFAEKEAARTYDGTHYLASLDALEEEQDNIRAALSWSLNGNHVEHGVALILANAPFWHIRSRALEAVNYVEKALQQTDHPELYRWYATYLDRLGQVDEAGVAARNLMEAAKAENSDELIAHGYIRLTYTIDTTNEAVPLVEHAFSHALKSNNKGLIADCHALFLLVLSKVRPEDARAHALKALALYEEIGDLHGISRITNNLAIHDYDIGQNRAEAKKLMEKSLQLKRTIHDPAGEARRLTTMSIWAMLDEELDLAQTWLKESRQISEELGEQDRLSYALTSEGFLQIMMVDLEQAEATLKRSLEIQLVIEDYRGVVDTYCLLGQLQLMQQNLPEAIRLIMKGIEAGTNKSIMPELPVLTYASYLWHRRNFDECIPIVALLSQNPFHMYSLGGELVQEQFLKPLIYRVQQHTGEKGWQLAIEQVKGRSVMQIFEELASGELAS